MGRRSRGKKKAMNFSISQEHADQLNLIFYDPVTRRADYGARSQLVDEFLGKWIEEYNLKLRESVQNDPKSPSFNPLRSHPDFDSTPGGSETSDNPTPPRPDPLLVK